jgi:hypothetical protein
MRTRVLLLHKLAAERALLLSNFHRHFAPRRHRTAPYFAPNKHTEDIASGTSHRYRRIIISGTRAHTVARAAVCSGKTHAHKVHVLRSCANVMKTWASVMRGRAKVMRTANTTSEVTLTEQMKTTSVVNAHVLMY